MGTLAECTGTSRSITVEGLSEIYALFVFPASGDTSVANYNWIKGQTSTYIQEAVQADLYGGTDHVTIYIYYAEVTSEGNTVTFDYKVLKQYRPSTNGETTATSITSKFNGSGYYIAIGI